MWKYFYASFSCQSKYLKHRIHNFKPSKKYVISKGNHKLQHLSTLHYVCWHHMSMYLSFTLYNKMWQWIWVVIDARYFMREWSQVKLNGAQHQATFYIKSSLWQEQNSLIKLLSANHMQWFQELLSISVTMVACVK